MLWMSECRYVCGNIMLQIWESMSMIIIINLLVVSSHPNQSSSIIPVLGLKNHWKKHVSVAKTIPCLPAMTGNGNEVYTNRKMLMTGGWCVYMRLWHWELPTGKYVTPPHLAWNLGWNVRLCLVIPLSHGIPWSVDVHEIGKRSQCVYYIWWRNG